MRINTKITLGNFDNMKIQLIGELNGSIASLTHEEFKSNGNDIKINTITLGNYLPNKTIADTFEKDRPKKLYFGVEPISLNLYDSEKTKKRENTTSKNKLSNMGFAITGSDVTTSTNAFGGVWKTTDSSYGIAMNAPSINTEMMLQNNAWGIETKATLGPNYAKKRDVSISGDVSVNIDDGNDTFTGSASIIGGAGDITASATALSAFVMSGETDDGISVAITGAAGVSYDDDDTGPATTDDDGPTGMNVTLSEATALSAFVMSGETDDGAVGVAGYDGMSLGMSGETYAGTGMSISYGTNDFGWKYKIYEGDRDSEMIKSNQNYGSVSVTSYTLGGAAVMSGMSGATTDDTTPGFGIDYGTATTGSFGSVATTDDTTPGFGIDYGTATISSVAVSYALGGIALSASYPLSAGASTSVGLSFSF